MGAWGIGVFDDDSSCDLIFDVIETDAESFIVKTMEHKGSEYLEYEECHEVIVAGAIMDMLLNKTVFAHQNEEFDEWLSKQNMANLHTYKNDLVECLNLVLSDKSELNELWEENEEDYPKWKSNITSIINNIGT